MAPFGQPTGVPAQGAGHQGAPGWLGVKQHANEADERISVFRQQDILAV
jgi:hypothetical protein